MSFVFDNLIPAPLCCEERAGMFVIDEHIAFDVPEQLRASMELLCCSINSMLSVPLPERSGTISCQHSRSIVFRLDQKAAEESFRLEITPDKLELSGDSAGVFYGVQMLRQMLLIDIDHIFPEKSYSLPCCFISDAPRFGYRGFMIDSARHFQSVGTLKKLIEKMALYRINRLHWHLMDNYGYRILLKSYPELATYDPETWFDAGLYTPEQIREVVEYARAHFITVIPEIEMPAHSGGIFKSHPEFACDPDAYQKHVYEYCIGGERAPDFLRSVLREIMTIFSDSKLCHLGGDESNHKTWENCPVCRAKAKELKAKNMVEFEHMFMLDMTAFVRKLGFRPMVWAGKSKYPKDVLIQAWHEGEAEIALKNGNQVVNSIHNFVYFDYPVDDSEDRFDWMPNLSLEKVYSFEPIPVDATKAQASLVLGGEACLWTEKVPEQKVLGKAFPRLCALAEILWCPQNRRDLKKFKSRAKIHLNSVLLTEIHSSFEKNKNLNIGDIAREAGVSKTAVSLFMNGKAKINKLAMETCSRIATTIRNNQYRPNTHAASMRRNRKFQVGFVLPDGSDYTVFWPIVAGASSVFDAGSYRMFLNLYADNLPAPRTVDMEMPGEDGALQLLAGIEKEHGVFSPPRIEVIVPNSNFVGYVEPDYIGIGVITANALVKAKHRKIAVLTYGERTYAGVLTALKNQLEALGATVKLCGSVAELTSVAFGSTAIYFDGDRAMLALYGKVAEFGWQIPNDVAVIGSGSRKIASMLNPLPSIIDFDWKTLGLEAAKMLLEVLEKQGKINDRIVVPSAIVGNTISRVPAGF